MNVVGSWPAELALVLGWQFFVFFYWLERLFHDFADLVVVGELLNARPLFSDRSTRLVNFRNLQGT